MNRSGAISGTADQQIFRRLRTALAVSSLGHWLSVPALTASAAALAGDDPAPIVAAVLALMALPALVLGPLGTLVAARLDRRVALLAADVLRFALVLSVPLVDAVPWTLAAAFLVACASLVWAPVTEGAVPGLVPDDEVDAARRSMLRAAYGAAPVAAVDFAILALIGGAVIGTDLPLYATAAVFLVSALAASGLRDLPLAARPAAAPLALAFRGQRGADPAPVPGLGLTVVVLAVAAAAVASVAWPYSRDLGGGDAGFAMIWAGLTFGGAFGLFLGPRMLAALSRRRLLALTVLVVAPALIAIALVQNLVVVVFLAALLGLAAGASWGVGAGLITDGFPLMRAITLVAGLVTVTVVPPVAGLLGERHFTLGDAAYDIGGAGTAQLLVGVLLLPCGLVAFRRLDDRRGIPLGADVRAALRGHPYAPPEEVTGPAVIRNRGVFIAFEGGEGAGKTTQARLAAIWLRDHGYDVVATQEPGATKIGMRLRAMLLDKQTTGLSPSAETLLYAADRADHVANVIVPAMERGAIVVSDRYVDSSLAYQGYGRGQDVAEIAGVNAWATGGLVPDLTVLLEVPPETGLGRLASPADRMESEPAEFHERVRQGFRALAEAEPDRYLIVDAGLPQHQISREIQYRIREILPDPIPAGTEDATSTFPAIRDA